MSNNGVLFYFFSNIIFIKRWKTIGYGYTKNLRISNQIKGWFRIGQLFGGVCKDFSN